MKADLSRETFDPARHYTAVRLQQGRVLTDADFNEQGELTRRRTERLAEDLVGASGGPARGAGFALSAGTRALAVHAAGADSVWIAGEDGTLLVSTDGGASWSLRPVATTRHLRAIAGAGSAGWAVGDGGTVLHTGNGGADWVPQEAGSLHALHGVAVLDAEHAWVVGDGGHVLRTVDGGASWTRHASGVDRLYAVAFASALNGLAVGQGGAILRSTDGGASWTRVPSAGTATLRAVQLAGANAWAAGDGGTLLRSTDGGASWSLASSDGSATLRALGFHDGGDIGWAAGDGGTLLGSNDGGASWTARPVAGSPDLAALSLAGAGPGWLVGGGQAWRVYDGGADAPADLPPASLHIGAGRYYVQGQLCEWEHAASLANQPGGGVAERLPEGTHLVYLHAWQRHVSALEDPRIREVALGGPDTATRAQQVAQVRALALPAAAAGEDWHCSAPAAAWDALTAAPTARLAARAEPPLAATGICDIAASAGYRRLENQLYRVEIHHVDASGAASFKWSRENGSAAYPVESVSVDAAADRTTVRVAMRGRDANLDLSPHDRVELLDDDAELRQRCGTLLEYLNDGTDALQLVLRGLPPAGLGQDAARHPLLRRWDHRPDGSGQHTLPVQEGSWITLEDGVQVRFSPGGRYRPGDYWQIPARTVTADVEWPRDADGEPVAELPAGVQDSWARLGLVTVDAGGWISSVTDCRELFPPLTQLAQLLYVGGDGQDASPGDALAEPLRVRVARGALAVPGARVRFAIETGDGALALAAPWGTQAGASVDALCDAEGLAQCDWQLGPAGGQRVRAQLLSSGGEVIAGQQLVFAAKAAAPAQGSGSRGCALTIGKGGDIEALTSELLAKLMDEHPALCLCFLPGQHVLDGLRLELSDRRPSRRLSMHGCGLTSTIMMKDGITLRGLDALQLRDLELVAGEKSMIELSDGNQVDLSGLRVTAGKSPARRKDASPSLAVERVQTLRMRDCELPSAPLASAVFQDIAVLCDIRQCSFAGAVALYGWPSAESRLRELRERLAEGLSKVQSGQGALVFASNRLARLTLGSDMFERLTNPDLKQDFKGLFHTVDITGNVFDSSSSACAGVLLTCTANQFTATLKAIGTGKERDMGSSNLYGILVSRAAAATGNIGNQFGDNATLIFLTSKGQFRGAGNMIRTEPTSMP